MEGYRIEALKRERDDARRATTSIADRAAVTAQELRARIEVLEAVMREAQQHISDGDHNSAFLILRTALSEEET